MQKTLSLKIKARLSGFMSFCFNQWRKKHWRNLLKHFGRKIMLQKTMNISFSVQEDILLSLKENAEEFTQNLRFLSALMLYRKNRLSLGKAAELAGYNKLDFIDKLRLENEPIFDFNAQEIDDIFADALKLP
jgi:predicted HTH domain antitoxin